MYSKVVEDLLGLEVVGALYLNPLVPGIRGACEGSIADFGDYPNVKIPNMRGRPFDELITITAAEVDERLTHLAAGDIEPDPYDASTCKYCPALLCEKRLA